jgi:hypothetical protein
MERIASSVGSTAQYRFSLCCKVVQYTSLRVNNYGYETKRRREKFYFRFYRSISFFTGFVECQGQELQQQNKKPYQHLLLKYIEIFLDAYKSQQIKKLNSLHNKFRK